MVLMESRLLHLLYSKRRDAASPSQFSLAAQLARARCLATIILLGNGWQRAFLVVTTRGQSPTPFAAIAQYQKNRERAREGE